MDLTDRIERLEAFEERCGVTFEGLYAAITDHDDMVVNGELHSVEGVKLKYECITVEAAAYDESGRMIAKSSEYFEQNTFFAFGIFSISIFLDGHNAKIKKIRLFPVMRY